MKTHRNPHTIAISISHTSAKAELVKSLLILSLISLIAPVFQGCSEHPQDCDFTEDKTTPSVKFAVHKIKETQIESLDVLVYNNDLLQRIDCYQEDEFRQGEPLVIGSRGGEKIVLICANMNMKKDSWREYSSFQKASSMKVELEMEDRDYPVMASYKHITTGGEFDCELERLTSQVEIRSICCDFTGKPYSGEMITHAKAYLINVNATCCLIPQETASIERLINHGGLMEQDMASFKDKTLIYSDIEDISTTPSTPSCRFLCYPSNSPEESIGTPFTKLVIEGKIQGETWYWPININRDADQRSTGTGIERNSRYVFDITIRSKGTKDPNIPVTSEMTELQFETKEWKEKEAYYVAF